MFHTYEVDWLYLLLLTTVLLNKYTFQIEFLLVLSINHLKTGLSSLVSKPTRSLASSSGHRRSILLMRSVVWGFRETAICLTNVLAFPEMN